MTSKLSVDIRKKLGKYLVEVLLESIMNADKKEVRELIISGFVGVDDYTDEQIISAIKEDVGWDNVACEGYEDQQLIAMTALLNTVYDHDAQRQIREAIKDRIECLTSSDIEVKMVPTKYGRDNLPVDIMDAVIEAESQLAVHKMLRD